METEWDYTELASSYVKRVDYSKEALEIMYHIMGLHSESCVCDVGAGVGHLTQPLSELVGTVVAVEPNDAMRALGIKRTPEKVVWVEGTGENTLQQSNKFDAVTFGSSFNVLDRNLALQETKRIVKPKGWFACMWNHRNLEDPVQKEIERIISANIEDFSYGKRREEQSSFLKDTGLFSSICTVEAEQKYVLSKEDWMEAWYSHATLQRQSRQKFEEIISQIESLLGQHSNLQIPYVTRIWVAKFKE